MADDFSRLPSTTSPEMTEKATGTPSGATSISPLVAQCYSVSRRKTAMLIALSSGAVLMVAICLFAALVIQYAQRERVAAKEMTLLRAQINGAPSLLDETLPRAERYAHVGASRQASYSELIGAQLNTSLEHLDQQMDQHIQWRRFFVAFSLVIAVSVSMLMLFVGSLGWSTLAANRRTRIALPDFSDATDKAQLTPSIDRRKNLVPVVEAARADERARISHDIHDELGAHLMGIKIDLKRSSKTASASRREVDSQWPIMLGRVDAAMTAVARIAGQLRPSLVNQIGLWPAIETYVREFEEITKLPCYLQIDINGAPLQSDLASVIFRIVQESLTNVARHAEASKVEVKISDASGRLEIEIEDDGKGISPHQILSPDAVGLHGMFERSKQFGGELHIDGRSKRGTKVSLRMPLPTPP